MSAYGYLWARQWISKDPQKADGEESAYQYCGGDPMCAPAPGTKRVGFFFTLSGKKALSSAPANLKALLRSQDEGRSP
jgi:hypothetical protein